jgi:hypothetical protein
VAGSWAEPEAQAILHDLSDGLLALLWRLPPPCCQIALLRLVHHASRSQILCYLRGWRSIGDAEGRRLVTLTNAMLRALGRDEDPSDFWPQGKGRKKNPWLTTPPPPIWPLRG